MKDVPKQHSQRNVFLSPLECEQIPNSTLWIVARDLRLVDFEGNSITVPTGFQTDFASIPPLARFGAIFACVFQFIARWLFPFYAFEGFALWVCFVAEWLENSGTDEIAAVHDWLYATQKIPRWKCDLILYHGMIAKNATFNPLWKCLLFWINVRLFGWIPWASDRKKRLNEEKSRLGNQNAL